MPSLPRLRIIGRRCVRVGGRMAFLVVASHASLAVAGLTEGLDALRKADYTAAAKELRPLADKGNAEAQYRIGLMYEFGKGYPQDMKQAAGWFRKSASQGHAASQMELGVMNVNGDGVPANAGEAVSWYRKSATQGNAAAQ
jgi:uncharacterized protein